MLPDLALILRADTRLEVLPSTCLRTPQGVATVADPTPGMVRALRRLADEGAPEEALCRLAEAADGTGERLRLLRYRFPAEGEPLAVVEPLTGRFRFRPEPLPAEAPCVLSRFAYLRRSGDTPVLESPRSAARLVLPHARSGALVAALSRPLSAEELAEAAAVPPETAAGFRALLWAAGMLCEVDAEGRSEEERSAVLAPWEFHDLLFHSRSRTGGHDYPVGAVFPFRDRFPPPPAVTPPRGGEVLDLHRPSLERLRREDPPLAEVLERRRSQRAGGAAPITREQLGEFLYRVARVRSVTEADRGRLYPTSSRPYPSGGAMYSLELYPVVRACAGIPAGLYHYDPLRHCLERVADASRETELLLAHARQACGAAHPPQVLLVLAARYGRVSWKYRSIAYALILKEVGVLYQTMYLAATAMGLAACALGAGDADLFAAAAGTDYLAEASVGEFSLNSGPEPDPPRDAAPGETGAGD